MLLEPEVTIWCGRCGLARASSTADGGLDAVASGIFRLIEGSVGVMQQFVDLVGGLAGRNAETQAHFHLGSACIDVASGDVAAHALGEFAGFGEAAARGNDEELFSAVTSDRVVGAEDRGDAAGDDAEDGVSGGMATRIIDRSEERRVG